LLLGRRRTSRLELELQLVDVEVVQPLDFTALIELEGVQRPSTSRKRLGALVKGVGALRAAVPKWSHRKSRRGQVDFTVPQFDEFFQANRSIF
jgi:hypothetical protein